MQKLLTKKRNKGFTLIELIVVIAVIAVLVLLATPKFLDYTRDAKDARAMHDARVVEDKILEYLVVHEELPVLPIMDPGDIQDAIDEGRVYGPSGPVTEVPAGEYKNVTDLPGVNDSGIKDGTPIANDNGDSFLIITTPIRTVNGGSESSVCTLREDQKLTGAISDTKATDSSFEGKFVSDEVHKVGDYYFGILSEDPTKVELTEYTGSETDIVIPGQIIVGGIEYTVTKITGPEEWSGIFEYYGADSIEIPCTIEHIGDYTFSGNNITSLTIPDSVTSIGEYALSDNQLTTVVIGSGLKSFISGSLKGQPNLIITVDLNNQDFMSYEHGLYTKDGTTLLSGTQYVANNLHPNVTIIADNAFRNNSLTNVVIPDSVITIGESAFYDNNISTLIIGNNVTSIGREAFNRNSLTNVTISDNVISIGQEAFRNNNLTDLIIGNSVISIGQQAFYGNDLIEVVIPDSVETIEAYAFEGNQLTSLTIGSNVKTIGDKAFRWNKITSVVIPDSVTTIGSEAFLSNKITNINIGNGLTTIGSEAFSYNGINSNSNNLPSTGPWAGIWNLSGSNWVKQ